MKTRCYNPNISCFARYGGRGITICERWRNDFSAFLEDMGPRPSLKHSIEREDNDGPYSPDNCHWALKGEQANNTRASRRLTHKGLTLTVTQWERRIGMSPGTLKQRLARGWSNADALERPIGYWLLRPKRPDLGHDPT